MHRGADPALEKHYVPTRSQRSRSVLTFFARDTGARNLACASADLTKASQNREVIAFCDHWKQVSGSDPRMLIMDQKVTTQQILGEPGDRGVKSSTLRMHSPSLTRQISALTSTDFKQITWTARPPQQAQSPRVHRRHAHQLPGHRPPAGRHRPGPRRPHRDHQQRL
jgi:hypothetical protein